MAQKMRNPGGGAAGAQKTLSKTGSPEDTPPKPRTSRDYGPQQRWKDRNPIALWAYGATRSAIRRGLIQRGPCEVCSSATADAHYPDHRQPLLIVWLCRLHHRRLHLAKRRYG